MEVGCAAHRPGGRGSVPHKSKHPKKPKKSKKPKKKDPPMADWFAVYRESDGEVLSYGTDVGVLRAGIAKKRVAGPPGREVWNTTTLELDAKPPPPPDVDRVDEFLDAVGNGIPAGRVNAIRTELAKLLGPHRFRRPSEPKGLE